MLSERLPYFLTLIFSLTAYCKAQNIDSLQSIVKNSVYDTAKVHALITLSEMYTADKILQYAEPALKIAEDNLKKTTNTKVLHEFYLKAAADALTNLGFYYEQYTNFEQSLSCHERALKMYEELGDKHCLANTLVGIGNAQLNLKDGKHALHYYSKALLICESTKDTAIMAPVYNNMGTVYTNEGRLGLALDYMHKSLKIYKASGDRSGVARQLCAISTVYQKQGNYEKAQQYNFEALEIEEGQKDNDQFEIARILHNIAHVYMSSRDTNKARPFFTRSLEISEKLNYKYGSAFCYTGLAKIFLQRGQKKKALDYFLKSLKMSREIKSKLGICVSLYYIADYYLKSGESSMALKYAKESMSVAKELNYPGKISSSAKLLYQIYKQTKNDQKALEMYELFVVLRDSINSQDARRSALMAQLQYDFDKKEAKLKSEQEKAILKYEKERAETEANDERKQLLILIGFTSTGLVAAISLLLFFRNKFRKKQKQIEFEKSILDFEQRALRAQMNPHFIFNAINSIQKYILNKEKQEAYDYLAKFSKLIRIVLNNSQEKNLLLHQELEMLRLYVELEQLRFGDFEFKLSIADDINEFETAVPAMLIQPYVENAIWHGLMNLENERKGILTLSIFQKDNSLRIVIEDNGIGRERAKQFKKMSTHTSLGMTLMEQRLIILNKMMEYENAEIIITDLYNDKKEGAGTRIEIVIGANGK